MTFFDETRIPDPTDVTISPETTAADWLNDFDCEDFDIIDLFVVNYEFEGVVTQQPMLNNLDFRAQLTLA